MPARSQAFRDGARSAGNDPGKQGTESGSFQTWDAGKRRTNGIGAAGRTYAGSVCCSRIRRRCASVMRCSSALREGPCPARSRTAAGPRRPGRGRRLRAGPVVPASGPSGRRRCPLARPSRGRLPAADGGVPRRRAVAWPALLPGAAAARLWRRSLGERHDPFRWKRPDNRPDFSQAVCPAFPSADRTPPFPARSDRPSGAAPVLPPAPWLLPAR
jgi:hypothetical protein